MVHLSCKIVQQFFEKLKIELPYDPAAPLLDIHPELKAGSQRDIRTAMFIAAYSQQLKGGSNPDVRPAADI